jgi:serine acetyltransferase
MLTAIMPKRNIRNNSEIDSGRVVIKNVKEGISVFGNPAQKIAL